MQTGEAAMLKMPAHMVRVDCVGTLRFAHPTLLADLISATTSPYRISAFWALHFSDHVKAVAVAETFLSAQSENRASKETLLGIDIRRSGTKVEFPTAYCEYLCK